MTALLSVPIRASSSRTNAWLVPIRWQRAWSWPRPLKNWVVPIWSLRASARPTATLADSAGYRSAPGHGLISYANSVSVEGTTITATRLNHDGIETVQAQVPAVVSVTEKSNTPRSPKIRGKMAAKKAVFDVWKVEDLGLDAASVGTSGSATKVTELFAPEPNPVGVMIEGATPADAAANLVKDLTAKNLL